MFELSRIRVDRGGRTVLDLPRLEIPTDKLVLILGHNGSGKSTLASLLAGLTRPDAGRVLLHDQDLYRMSDMSRARAVAFLPQKLPASEGLCCRELVRLGRYPWRGLLGRWRPADEAAIDAAMNDTGTARFAAAYADELSGGERQRVWIAMLLAQASPVMILDEPTSALDIQHQYGVLALLETLVREHARGVIAIIHDINLALRFAEHVVALKSGRLLFEGDAAMLRSEDRLLSLFGTDIRLIDHPNPPEAWQRRHLGEKLKAALICA